MKIILTARNTTLKKNKSSICLKRRKAPFEYCKRLQTNF